MNRQQLAVLRLPPRRDRRPGRLGDIPDYQRDLGTTTVFAEGVEVTGITTYKKNGPPIHEAMAARRGQAQREQAVELFTSQIKRQVERILDHISSFWQAGT